mmetsp:Transcript_13818/g.49052  ORF Transcript_13818/g.49052 Transcript_13818/m.49052 type:complete len:209 (-) Transcript_13818:1432-2058(-)
MDARARGPVAQIARQASRQAPRQGTRPQARILALVLAPARGAFVVFRDDVGNTFYERRRFRRRLLPRRRPPAARRRPPPRGRRPALDGVAQRRFEEGSRGRGGVRVRPRSQSVESRRRRRGVRRHRAGHEHVRRHGGGGRGGRAGARLPRRGGRPRDQVRPSPKTLRRHLPRRLRERDKRAHQHPPRLGPATRRAEHAPRLNGTAAKA